MTITAGASPSLEVSRVEPDGTTVRAALSGREGERMLVQVHLPASEPRGAVVICSPVLGEFMRNYRREVLLARRFAHRGYAVERFHYRFSGNSDGDDAQLSFDSMREDALACVEHLRSEAPGGPLFLLGTRWGAPVAAAAASSHLGAGLILLEPLLEASRFFKEAFRSRMVKDLRAGTAQPVTSSELEERLCAGEPVEVPGYRLMPELYASSLGRSLERELGTTPRPVLAVQIGPTGAVRPDLDRQIERWRAAGLDVDGVAVRGEESWWLVDERFTDEGQRPMTRELLSLTTRWIEDHTPGEGVA